MINISPFQCVNILERSLIIKLFMTGFKRWSGSLDDIIPLVLYEDNDMSKELTVVNLYCFLSGHCFFYPL